MRPNTPTLSNAFVSLEPLAASHREGLRQAAGADSGVFAYMPADLTGRDFDTWFDWSMGRANEMVWAVRQRSDGQFVGSTRYLNAEWGHKRVEIGYTWYVKSVWGGPVNPSCKYLLFDYGFHVLDLNRVELKTDARNARSRAAIAKLGAVEEGILRRHMVVQNGYVRDTVYFSLIAEEWPAAKAKLLARLAAFA